MIDNVTGCCLVTLIDSLKCVGVGMGFQCLGRVETQSLVQAMESRVDTVSLDSVEILDIEALTEYSGRGKCWLMGFSYSISDEFFTDLMTWASRKNWLFSLKYPKEVKVEDKIRRVYKIFLFEDLKRYELSNQLSPADVTIRFVNSASIAGTESSLTINMEEVSGLDDLMELLRLAGINTETEAHMITLVREASPEIIITNVKEETPEAVFTEAKEVTPAENIEETIDVADVIANYDETRTSNQQEIQEILEGFKGPYFYNQ